MSRPSGSSAALVITSLGLARIAVAVGLEVVALAAEHDHLVGQASAPASVVVVVAAGSAASVVAEAPARPSSPPSSLQAPASSTSASHAPRRPIAVVRSWSVPLVDSRSHRHGSGGSKLSVRTRRSAPSDERRLGRLVDDGQHAQAVVGGGEPGDGGARAARPRPRPSCRRGPRRRRGRRRARTGRRRSGWRPPGPRPSPRRTQSSGAPRSRPRDLDGAAGRR